MHNVDDVSLRIKDTEIVEVGGVVWIREEILDSDWTVFLVANAEIKGFIQNPGFVPAQLQLVWQQKYVWFAHAHNGKGKFMFG